MAEKDIRRDLTRRDFLKAGSGAAATLAALGAPAILRSQDMGSKISVGVIGTGSRGCYLTRLFRDHGAYTITDVCDIYPPNLEHGAGDSGNPDVRKHEDWRELVARQDIDAVVVAPPLFLHVPCSLAALQAGKHVLSEKSMALDMKQLKQMKAAAAASGKVYLVGFQGRMSESLAEAQKLVRGGALGSLVQCYVHYDHNRIWRKPDIPPEWERVLNWRMYREYCGGILTELLTHQIDQVLDVLGTMPAEASCRGDILVYKDGREHHDTLMGTMVMDDGLLVTLSGGLCNSRWGASWAVHGTHGTLESLGGMLRIFWEKDTSHLSKIGVKHKFTKIALGQSLDIGDHALTEPDKVVDFRGGTTRDTTVTMIGHFHDCIVNGTKPKMDAESAGRTSVAALMLYASSFDNGRVYTREEVEAAG